MIAFTCLFGGCFGPLFFFIISQASQAPTSFFWVNPKFCQAYCSPHYPFSLPFFFPADSLLLPQWASAGHDQARPRRPPRATHHRGLVGLPLAPAGSVAMRGHGHLGAKRGLAREIKRGGAAARPLVLSRVCTPPSRGHGAGAAEKRGTGVPTRGRGEVPILATSSSASRRKGCPRQGNHDGLPTTNTSLSLCQSRNTGTATVTSSRISLSSAFCHSLFLPQAFHTGWTELTRYRPGPHAAVQGVAPGRKRRRRRAKRYSRI